MGMCRVSQWKPTSATLLPTLGLAAWRRQPSAGFLFWWVRQARRQCFLIILNIIYLVTESTASSNCWFQSPQSTVENTSTSRLTLFHLHPQPSPAPLFSDKHSWSEHDKAVLSNVSSYLILALPHSPPSMSPSLHSHADSFHCTKIWIALGNQTPLYIPVA